MGSTTPGVAVRVDELPEQTIVGDADAGADTHRQLALIQAVQTEVTLARIANRRCLLAWLTAVLLPIFKVGQQFIHFLLWRVLGVGKTGIKDTRRVGAGRDAIAAADALLIVNGNNAIVAFIGSADGTNGHTGWFVALHTRPRHKTAADVRIGTDFLV